MSKDVNVRINIRCSADDADLVSRAIDKAAEAARIQEHGRRTWWMTKVLVDAAKEELGER
jgi:uncharacterized protein (DUF1778 family)